METNYNNDERYFQAKKRVEEIKGFYGHLTSFILVNIFLFVMNIVTSPNELWFFWPTIGWGIGLLFHGMKVFGYSPFFNKDWENQKIKEFMEKENQNKQTWN
jgi:2TM domain